MTQQEIRYLNLGLFSVAMLTLALELTLMRVFDVLWYPNMAYMVITLAMFAFAFSGVYVSLRPMTDSAHAKRRLAILTVMLGVFAALILPAVNYLPIDFSKVFADENDQFWTFFALYVILAIPFFLSGIVFSTVFSVWPGNIQRLYLWDLTGAAVGSVILIPLLPSLTPGGILLLVLACALLASGLFSDNRAWLKIAAVSALAVAIATIAMPKDLLVFKEHMVKRGLSIYRAKDAVEKERWDPTSKIDVVNHNNGAMRIIIYDGGNQASGLLPFDGDYAKLRASLPGSWMSNFNYKRMLTSHMLKEGSGAEVLVIGAAGGQETKAALAYGASRVDAVELVDYVVRLVRDEYADYVGGLYNDPRVTAHVAEGRSFLRATDRKYDIIQMFSNHTSSSIAAGSGAMATNYLQTAEAYEEYFTHLKDDGILQINHHLYPKMVVTAALAWQRLGRTDFRRHVLLCSSSFRGRDDQPMFLVKMSPWTAEEVSRVKGFVEPRLKCHENPVDTAKGALPDPFYAGEFTPEFSAMLPYRGDPATDDQPYFNHIRKSLSEIEYQPDKFMSPTMTHILNDQLKGSVLPRDVIHLFVTAAASILAVALFILIPMVFSRTGRVHWNGKIASMVYFSCLGAGFIIVELVFIQLFMKLVGYPVYTYSTVVFGMLFAAGIGSYLSGQLAISPKRNWIWPFIGVLLTGMIFLLTYQQLFTIFLAWPVLLRALVAIVLIFPVGLFMGMLFPLGILALKDEPAGSIAWAWAMNGLFTVVGGLLSVVLSMYLGFNTTLVIALSIYLVGWAAFVRMRNAVFAAGAAG